MLKVKKNKLFLDDGGTIFEGAIQTGVIKSEKDNSLRLSCCFILK